MDLVCSACGTVNPSVARFCMSCGAAFTSGACRACGHVLPPDARFCPACGTPAVADETSGTPKEERRIVSVLFADIVGYTSRSDGADPEDVRRLLVPFHGRVKEDIESFGGTLDKFIGDAAMGVFGEPVAHEDDPERAVSAALKILETIADLNRKDPNLGINVRVGINTGEAMVTFASGPVVGENVAGDVVNTASRLQGVAQPGTIVMGEATYRATRGLFEVEQLEPVSVKNKAEPLNVWRVLGVRETPEPVAATPFVGRATELAFLEDTYDWTLLHSTLRFVTIVGEPGIGKSRLVDEFHVRLAERAGMPQWLRGRCRPYGEGITFAPLRDVVRKHAGISVTDTSGEALARLSDALIELGAEPVEREWLLARLGPLVGAGAADGAESVGREEAFGAWSRYLELLAARPLVVVFEDLDRGDPAFLDFLQHAATRLAVQPVLIVGTARPELLAARPGWTDPTDAALLQLTDLTDGEMDALLRELLPVSALTPASQSAVREGAGGNPLFAIEFARMAAESGGGTELPGTLQGLVAARLDALPAGHRALVHDAAILGDRLWPPALAWMGGIAETVAGDVLEDLVVRGLLFRAREPALPDVSEFTFANTLMREVAYRQMPRAARARKHIAAGEWLEREAGARGITVTELLAFHFYEAVRLTREAGDELPERLLALARRYLAEAGDAALRLDVAQAYEDFRRALDLTPVGHPDRPGLITNVVRAGRRCGVITVEEAERLMQEAVEQLRGAGDLRAAGHAMVRRSLQLGMMGEAGTARAVLGEAIEILEREPAGVELAHAYAAKAEEEMFAGRPRASLEWSGRAIDLLGGVGGSVEVRVMAYQLRGTARCELGDANGLEDLGEALEISYHLGLALEAAQSRTYLGEATWQLEGPAKGLEYHETAIEQSLQRGLTGHAMWTSAESLWMLFDLGEWDRVLERADDVMAWDREHGSGYYRALAGPYRARVLLHRGKATEVGADAAAEFIRFARQAEDLQTLAPALTVAAMLEVAGGDPDGAMELIEELDGVTRDRSSSYREAHLPDLVETCLAVKRMDLAERLLEGVEGLMPRQRHCVTAAQAIVAAGQKRPEEALELFEEAAEGWAAFGGRFERARADLGAGRALLTMGRRIEAAERMDAARATFGELRAAPWSSKARVRRTPTGGALDTP